MIEKRVQIRDRESLILRLTRNGIPETLLQLLQELRNNQIELIERDWRTTLMIRNIPNKYTINELSAEIDSEHANTYDFLYLPCDLKVRNLGYVESM